MVAFKKLPCVAVDPLDEASMRFSDMRTPITSSNWNDGKFGNDDSTTDSCCYFLGTFDSKSHMSTHPISISRSFVAEDCGDVPIKVTDSNESLEPGTLTCRSLFLYGSDAHYFVLESG